MFVAVYARVSTGMQASEGTSLENQIVMCTNKAKEMGIAENLRIYKEEGFSGEDIDRPAMNQLRQDVSSGIITHVICTHPDRLSRDMTDKLLICREFEKYGVKLYFVDTEYKNTPEGQLFFNMQSAIAQYELALIKKRTVRGRLRAVETRKQIMPMRVAPYGYDYADGKLVINEQEAEFVKKIYEWYVYDNLTMREIGDKLYMLGAIPKRGESKNWHASSINRILSSEVYIGNYYYNRRKTSKKRGEKTQSGNPRITYSIRDESEWIRVDVPAIIDEHLFELAQKQRINNTINSGNIKHNYLLRSLIKCGHCGRAWQCTFYSGRKNKKTGEKERYYCYRCPNKYPKKYGEGVERCPTNSIKAERIESIIWSYLVKAMANPNIYFNALKNKNDTVIQEIQNTIEKLYGQIEKIEKEKEKIKIMFRRDVITEDEMISDMEKVNAEMSKLQNEIDELNKRLKATQQSERTKEKLLLAIEKLKDISNNPDNVPFETKRKAIEQFIDKIIIKQDGDITKLTIVGELSDVIEMT